MKTLQKLEVTFCKDLQDDLLNGATIIWHNESEYNALILVRLPKGKWEEVKDGRKFEYKIYEQTVESSMYHASSNNNHIRAMKAKASDEYHEERYCLTKKYESN